MKSRDSGGENIFSLPKLDVNAIKVYPDSRKAVVEPGSVKLSSEKAKERCFFEPDDDQVMKDLSVRLEQVPKKHQDDLVLRLGNCQVLGFAVDADMAGNGDWQRVPPASWWKNRGKEFCMNLVICFDEQVSASDFAKDFWFLADKPKDFSPSYYSMLVYSQTFALGRKFDDEEKMKGFRLHRNGFPGKDLAKTFEACLKDERIDVQCRFWSAKSDDRSLKVFRPKNDGGVEIIEKFGGSFFDVHNWGDRNNEYALPARYLVNRMAMIAVDGPSVPDWYHQREKIRKQFKEQSVGLLQALGDSGILVGLEDRQKDIYFLDLLIKEIDKRKDFDPKLERDQRYRWMHDVPSVTIPFGGSRLGPLYVGATQVNVGHLMEDQTGMIFSRLSVRGKKCNVDGFGFEVRISKSLRATWRELGEHPKLVVEGIEITSDDYPDVSLILINLTPEEMSDDEVDKYLSDVGKMKISGVRVESRHSIPEPYILRAKE